MSKFSLAIAALVLTFTTSFTQAATGYISDNVYVYFHTGPSAKYRIVGSVISGSKVEIVEHSEDGKYTKIVDDKGRTGWIQSEFASTQSSLKQRFEALTLQVAALSENNLELEQRSEQSSQSTGQLQQRISTLSAELASAKREKIRVEAKLVGEEADIKMKWLINGGILVIISILLGIFITFIPSKKKSKGNWS